MEHMSRVQLSGFCNEMCLVLKCLSDQGPESNGVDDLRILSLFFWSRFNLRHRGLSVIELTYLIEGLISVYSS